MFTFAPGFTIDTTLPAGNSTPAIARCSGAYEFSLRLYRVRQREKNGAGAGVEWNNGVAISRESSPRGMILRRNHGPRLNENFVAFAWR